MYLYCLSLTIVFLLTLFLNNVVLNIIGHVLIVTTQLLTLLHYPLLQWWFKYRHNYKYLSYKYKNGSHTLMLSLNEVIKCNSSISSHQLFNSAGDFPNERDSVEQSTHILLYDLIYDLSRYCRIFLKYMNELFIIISMQYNNSNDILYDKQFGFRKGHSTTHHLMP